MWKEIKITEGLEIIPPRRSQALKDGSLWQSAQGALTYKHWEYFQGGTLISTYQSRLAPTLHVVSVQKLTKFDMFVQCFWVQLPLDTLSKVSLIFRLLLHQKSLLKRILVMSF